MIDPFQALVAQIALAAASEQGFALAGANALVAHGLLTRPTEDVDLFSPEPGGPGRVFEAVRDALLNEGFTVQVTRAPAENAGEFAQLHVSRASRTTQVDLGRDWRAHKAVVLDIGPVLHLDDAVASKVTALLGRGLARDYIDVAAALDHDRYPRRRLLQLAFMRDPGLRVLDVALAAQRLDQLPDSRFVRYKLDPDQVRNVRARFSDWPRDSGADQSAQAAHDAAHRTEPSPAQRAAAAYPVPLDQALGQAGPAPPPTPSAPPPDPQLPRRPLPSQTVRPPPSNDRLAGSVPARRTGHQSIGSW